MKPGIFCILFSWKNGWLSQKSLDLRAYKQDFKLNLLPIYYFWGKEPWYAARNPASPATSTQHWERINENWIRRIRGVSLSLHGRTGTPLFLCPHVTQAQRISVSWGAVPYSQYSQDSEGIYTFRRIPFSGSPCILSVPPWLPPQKPWNRIVVLVFSP